MIKIILSAVIISTISGISCSPYMLSMKTAEEEISNTALLLRKDRNNIYKLDLKTTGRNGYFYTIRNNGTISHHPKKALINYDFSSIPSVKKILKERNGCLTSSADGVSRIIFFREIDSEEILCLTMESSEFDETIKNCDSDIEGK